MSEYIANLDAALAVNGDDVILRRIIGVGNVVNIDVDVRANVRRAAGDPKVVVAGITHDDVKVIISPTQIREKQWPGGVIPDDAPFNPDAQLPRRGDRLIIKGREYRIEAVDPISVSGEVVRINMITLGGASGG
jgi:hypothetical protein